MIAATRAPWVIAATAAGTAFVFGYQPDVAPSAAATGDGMEVETGVEAPRTGPQQVVQAAPVKVLGPTVDTDFGPVRVAVKLDPSSLAVLSATAVTFPVELPKSKQINMKAIPALQRTAVGLSGPTSVAGIASVSGATYTSEGFRTSLAAALTKARKSASALGGVGR